MTVKYPLASWTRAFRNSAIAAVLVVVLQPIAPTQAGTFNIPCNDVAALIAAINTANGDGAADTINLADSCIYTLAAADNGSGGNANGLPLITTEVTLDGNGSTLQRSSAEGIASFRLLRIEAGGVLNLYSTTLTNGLAFQGGGIYNAGTSLLNVVYVDGNHVVNFQSEGGGIYNSGTLTLLGSQVNNNSATSAWSYGGGLYNTGGTVVIHTSAFLYNSASSGSETRGGAIYSVSGSLALDGVSLHGNSASGNSSASGGGVYISGGDAALTDVRFSSNTAAPSGTGQGGAMVVAGGAAVDIEDTQFVDNSAGYGGGLYVGSSEPTVMNTTFVGNHANWDGGGLSIEYSTNPKLTNVIFSGNTAQNGGGIANTFSHPTLTNLTLSKNSANGKGGGMYIGICWLTNGSQPVIQNTILWDNHAAVGSTAVQQVDKSACANNDPQISYSLVEGALPGGVWDTALGTDGGHNIDVDPRFVDPDGSDGILGTEDDNLGLGSGSPAADAGSNALVPADSLDVDEDANITEAVPLDLAYKARFIDAPEVPNTGSGTPPIVDMGAYERLAHILLPLILRNF